MLIATHKLPLPFACNSSHPHPLFLIAQTVMMEATISYETPVPIYQSTRCHISEEMNVKNVNIKQIWKMTYLTEFANISAHNHVIVPHSPVLIIPFKRFLQSCPCSYLLVHLHICFGQVVPSFKTLKSFHRRACSCVQFYFILNVCCPISYDKYCCN